MNKLLATVSIVLPTYNGAQYLNESIQSCLNQTYTNIELIIVDDGSTIELSNILKYYYDDPRVHYIKKENNSGLPSALNTGFKIAAGDYLTWTSDDNLYHKDAISVMVERLENDAEADFVFCDYQLIDEESNVKETVHTGNLEDLYINNNIGPCFLYRRKIYDTIGDYDKNCTLVEDYDYWLRIMKCFKMVRIDKCLYFFRWHKSSLTGKYGNSDFINQQLKTVKKKNLSKTMFFLSTSREYFINNKNGKSIIYAFLSICLNLTNKNAWFYFLKNIKSVVSNLFLL